MADRPKAPDQRPGVMPDISAEGNSVIYTIPVQSDRESTRNVCFVVRCDEDGTVSGRITGLEDGRPLAVWTRN